jgi:steroid delta-isomerase-like uncharacterized protein
VSAKDLIYEGVTAWNRRDRAAYLAVYAEDCTLTSPNGGGKGHDAVSAFFDATLRAFPDNRVRVDALAADGDLFAEEGVVTGTNTGPLPMPDGTDGPATGAALELPYAAVHVVNDGRIVHSRYYWDQMTMLGQLGLLPPS